MTDPTSAHPFTPSECVRGCDFASSWGAEYHPPTYCTQDVGRGIVGHILAGERERADRSYIIEFSVAAASVGSRVDLDSLPLEVADKIVEHHTNIVQLRGLLPKADDSTVVDFQPGEARSLAAILIRAAAMRPVHGPHHGWGRQIGKSPAQVPAEGGVRSRSARGQRASRPGAALSERR